MPTDRVHLLAAVHLFLVRDGKVLLLRGCNTGYEDGNFSVPAGHLDGGETMTAAAVREAWEEVGVVIAEADLRVVGVMHRRAEDERIDFFLEAAGWTGDVANREPTKCDGLLWADPDGLPPNVVPYVRRALEHDHASVWFESYGWDDEAPLRNADDDPVP